MGEALRWMACEGVDLPDARLCLFGGLCLDLRPEGGETTISSLADPPGE